MACDALTVPVVTGDVNLAALEDLVRICVQMDKLRHHRADDSGQDTSAPDTTRVWEALKQAIIGKTMNFLLLSEHSL